MKEEKQLVRIREADYHHGAFTTFLVNNGFKLSWFETKETRRSYKVSKDGKDYLIYSKFASSPSSTNENRKSITWSFSFSDEEIKKIKEYQTFDSTCLIALTAHYGGADGGELILLTVSEFLKVIGGSWNVKSGRVSIMKEYRKQLRVYGTGIDRGSAFIPSTDLLKFPPLY